MHAGIHDDASNVLVMSPGPDNNFVAASCAYLEKHVQIAKDARVNHGLSQAAHRIAAFLFSDTEQFPVALLCLKDKIAATNGQGKGFLHHYVQSQIQGHTRHFVV